MKKILVLAAAILLTAVEVFAVKAYPHLVTFTQPDNSTISIYIKGDEKVHWMESEDGYSLLYNKEGYLVYAIQNEKGDMVPSDIIATNKASRSKEVVKFLNSTPKYLRYTQAQQNEMVYLWNIVEEQKSQKNTAVTKGKVKLLLILMQFKDKSFTRSKAEVEALFNQVNYTSNGYKGSVHDYYYANSYGQLSLEFDIAGPYTTQNNTAYYGNRGSSGYQAFAREAVNAAAADVDYSNYDNNNDGEVDGLHILYAGYGEEATGNANLIWSHKSIISPTIRHDGTNISVYSCSPELRGSSGGRLTFIGVICHELGHVFGAPDFYDTDYESSGGEYPGTGEWDLMGSGNWNENGLSPAHHNPYTKIFIYKWANAIDLDSACSVVMESSSDSPNSFYRYYTKTQNEYFLLENRQPSNFDAALPGRGMLIYHVHPSMTPEASNVNTTHPQRMFPVNAGSSYRQPTSNASSYGTVSSGSCTFPGSRNKTSFTDNTTPAAISWNGENTEKPITDIVNNNTLKTISFVFNGGVKEAGSFKGIANSSTSMKLSWLNYGNLPVMLVYSVDSTFGTPSNSEYSAGSTIEGGGTILYVGSSTSYIHQNLNPEQTYYYKLYTKINNTPTWSEGIAGAFTTPCAETTSFPYREGFENDTIIPNCWSMETSNENIAWVVKNRDYISPSQGEQCLFVKLSNYETIGETARVTTSLFDFGQQSQGYLVFNYMLRKRASYQDSLTVLYRSSLENEWSVLKTYSPNDGSWTKDTIQLPNVSSSYQLAFQATLNYGNGVAIDNIIVSDRLDNIGINTVTNNATNIVLHPNPAKDEVFVTIPADANNTTYYTIYNVVGQAVSPKTLLNADGKIDVRHLKTGSYVVKFTSDIFESSEILIIK